MALVPGAIGAVIVGSQPLVTALISAMMIRSDRLTIGKIVTIIAGITGVILISAGRQALHLGNAAELIGIGLIFIANMATSVSNVFISSRSSGMNPFVLSSFTLGIGGLSILILSLIFEKQPGFDMPLRYWFILGWLSFVAAFAFSIWFKLLQRPGVKVSELNLWKFIIPGVGGILSWIFIPGEHPDWLTVSGMLLITVTLILFFRSNNSNKVPDKA